MLEHGGYLYRSPALFKEAVSSLSQMDEEDCVSYLLSLREERDILLYSCYNASLLQQILSSHMLRFVLKSLRGGLYQRAALAVGIRRR